MILTKNKYHDLFKNFKFKAGNDIIKKFNKNIRNYNPKWPKLYKEVNKLSSQLHNRIINIKILTKFTNFRTRLNFLNGFVIGKINYMLPIYSLTNTINKNKIHKIITTAARAAIGNFCFKKSI